MKKAEQAVAGRVRRGRWPLVAALAWVGVVGGLLVVVFGKVWADDLSDVSGARLLASYAAFMAATFSYHLGLAGGGAAAFGLLARRRRLMMAAVVLLALGAGPEAARGLWPRRVEAREGAGVLTVMSVNLMYGRTDMDVVMAEIGRWGPDVVVFQEWTARAGTGLSPRLRGAFPHSVVEPREDAFGQAVFSSRPFARPARAYPAAGGFAVPQITVEVELDGRPVRVTNVHTLPPVGRAYFREQRRMAVGLAAWAEGAGEDSPHVLAGDFNAVSGSAVLGAMRRAGLVEAHRGAGWWRGSTWPRKGTLRWAPGIRLDHVVHVRELVCVESVVGRDVGSDHAPVVARLRWR